ncbi:putative membrane protein (plasmid) [Ochrobactrum quorumnocens]|uniref:Putative membrane protein n=1 Tax=Ochrobactrum quorumnocens TaxID=271865 RepID=A0A248UNC9_9HYPH|nr:putative membrane protein [[Ochrobactrum] quorumnocens]
MDGSRLQVFLQIFLIGSLAFICAAFQRGLMTTGQDDFRNVGS